MSPVTTPAAKFGSLRLRGKLLLIFGVSTALMLGAVAYGFWSTNNSLNSFETDVANSQRNTVAVVTMEATFKKQVQEWKDTLLRGKKPEALEKYWGNFQKREAEVRAQADKLSRNIGEPESKQLVVKFLDAHKTMGEAYRRGLEAFKNHNFDSAAGDAAVAGIDRAPTELLGQAKDRLLANATALSAAAASEAD
ncbi:MAG: hypothetical protein B7Y77_00840, partial [Bradyrhizobium sp. 35-63-5]